MLVAPQILSNLNRLRTDKPLLNRVDIKKEY